MSEQNLTQRQRDDLRIVAAMIVPASDEYKVPGADDAAIQADMLNTLGRDTAPVMAALDHLARLAGKPLAELDQGQQDKVATEFRAQGGGAAATLEDRWLGRTFPQLDLRELDQHSYAHQELTAKAFALAPKSTFVYAKLDLDKDIASGDSDSFPVKNEALLVTGVEQGRVDVLTADGLHFRVKDTHVLLAPEGAAAVVPAASRALHKLDLGEAMNMLPTAAKNLAAAHEKRIAAHEACVDRVWAPYGRQLPTYTHPAGVEIVTYESPRERAIKDAGNNAVDKQCGTAESVDKGSEQERVKMVAAIEKARAKLLADATAAWH